MLSISLLVVVCTNIKSRITFHQHWNLCDAKKKTLLQEVTEGNVTAKKQKQNNTQLLKSGIQPSNQQKHAGLVQGPNTARLDMVFN